MITPREKAILVGAMFGGAKILKDGDFYGVDYSNSNDPLKTWISNNLYSFNYDGSSEKIDFFHKLFDKFRDGKFPLDYYEKMSPLALAIFVIARNNKGEFNSIPSNHDTYHQLLAAQIDDTIHKIWRNKWGINLKTENNIPETEYDLINLWLLLKQYILEIQPSMAPTALLSKYPRKHKMVYLSGGQQFSKDGGVNWRARVSPAFYKLGYDVFNPAYEGAAVADQFGVNLNDLNLEDYIAAGGLFIEKDLEAIKASDAVLTFLDESALKGAGTKSEATVAVDYNIPNFFVLDKDIDPRKLPMWLAGCMRDVKYIIWNNDFDTAIHEINGILGS